jgi:hypothetical protein
MSTNINHRKVDYATNFIELSRKNISKEKAISQANGIFI